MNKISLGINVLLIVAVGILFYLHFGNSKAANKLHFTSEITTNGAMKQPFRIAYFDMDSVESNFSLAKEMQIELTKREEIINIEMSRLQNNFQSKYQKFQEAGPTMNQVQLDNAQRELFELEQSIKSRKSQLDQDYQRYYLEKQKEIISMIKNFCEEFNKNKTYTLIIANEPGLIYYKDSTYNITALLLQGLNEMKSKSKQ